MFEAQTGDVDLQQKDIDGFGEIFVNSGVGNCGIKGRTSRPARVFPANTITVDFFGNAYYRSSPYKMATHNHVFSLSGDILKNELIGLYVVGTMSYLTKVFSYNDMGTWAKIRKQTITLPVSISGDVDLAYMESFIRELESTRVRELGKWLVASGLDNCRLTAKEHKSLEDWQSGRVHCTKFKIRDLFELKKGKRLTKADMKSGNINFIGASAENNGITNYISNSKHLHSPNTITVSYNGSVGEAFYQADQFWASDDINVFYPKFRMEEASALYLIPLIKQQGRKYSYSNKWTKEEMEETVLLIPVTSSGSPDIDFMEHFVHAVIKQVIQGVVEWKDREIAATKKAIAPASHSTLAIGAPEEGDWEDRMAAFEDSDA